MTSPENAWRCDATWRDCPQMGAVRKLERAGIIGDRPA